LFTHLKLRNWRNFVDVDLPIGERLFITRPNADLPAASLPWHVCPTPLDTMVAEADISALIESGQARAGGKALEHRTV
jgi:hypothetical protein